MQRDLEHPEITWIERTGYPSWMQEGESEVLNDEDDEDYEREFWGDEFEDGDCDRCYEERREEAMEWR